MLVTAGPRYFTLVTVEVDASCTWTPRVKELSPQGQGHLAFGHVVVELGLTESSVYRAKTSRPSLLRRRPVRNTIAQRSDDLED